VTIEFTVAVPTGTPAGAYSGHVKSLAKGSHGAIDPGQGFFISITVPLVCDGVAEVFLTTPDNLTIWPPNHSMVSLQVTGTVNLPSGCSVLEANYTNEYGMYTSSGPLSLGEDKKSRSFSLLRHGVTGTIRTEGITP